MHDRPISLVMLRIGELAIAHGAAPINRLAGCWAHRVDERWCLAVNGHAEPQTYRNWDGIPVAVPAFSAYVEYNGWPFGFVDPFGGQLGAGEAANEDTLLAALDRAIAAAARSAGPDTPTEGDAHE